MSLFLPFVCFCPANNGQTKWFLFAVECYQMSRGRVAHSLPICRTMNELNDSERIKHIYRRCRWPFTGLTDFQNAITETIDKVTYVRFNQISHETQYRIEMIGVQFE